MRRLALALLPALALASAVSAQERRALPFAPFEKAKAGDWAVYVDRVETGTTSVSTFAVALKVERVGEGVVELSVERRGKPPARATVPIGSQDPAALLTLFQLDATEASVARASSGSLSLEAGKFEGSWVSARGVGEVLLAPDVRAGTVVVVRGTQSEIQLAGCGSAQRVEHGRAYAAVVPTWTRTAPVVNLERDVERLFSEIEKMAAEKERDLDGLIVKFSELAQLMGERSGPASPDFEKKLKSWDDRLERLKPLRLEIKHEIYRRAGEAELTGLDQALVRRDADAISQKRVRIASLVEKLLQEDDAAFQTLAEDLRARAFALEQKQR